MKRKDLRKLIIVVSLVTALAIAVPFTSGCFGKPAAAPPAAPPAPGEAAPPAPAAPAVEAPLIKWRMQTYAGAALGQHVCKEAVDKFNRAAAGRMEISLYFADELVPHGELFRALQEGTVDAVQSDDDSIAAPVDVAIFAAYFPCAVRYGIDNNALWNWYGLDDIWREAYDEVPGVTWLNSGSWDPCNFGTTTAIRKVEDLKGLRVYMFPTGGRFMTQFGVIPMALPYEDVEMAVQTGELDGECWCGITEMYTVGWADVNNYFLTNNISGGWMGSYFVNTDSWNALPDDLQALFLLMCEESHYYRLHWYWWGEAHYRVTGGKMELTTIPDEEWKVVTDAAIRFWDEEIAPTSPRCARVVEIFKEYNKDMEEAGFPYR